MDKSELFEAIARVRQVAKNVADMNCPGPITSVYQPDPSFKPIGCFGSDKDAMLHCLLKIAPSLPRPSAIPERHRCPQCGGPVERVPPSQWLNREQWDASKAGDSFCKTCPSNDRGNSPICYWNDNETETPEYREAVRLTEHWKAWDRLREVSAEINQRAEGDGT